MSFYATICFTSANCAMSEITNQAGLECILYYASGGLLAGAGYHIIAACRDRAWTNQNVVIDGRLSKMNLFRYLMNCLVYFSVITLCQVTMFFANRSSINVGVIITIWSINPFFNSIADYYFYNEKMVYYHFIGLVSILLCSIAICMKDFTSTEVKIAEYPSWIPVMFGLVAPLSFSAFAMLTKNLTSERVGFNATILSFSSQFSINLLLIIVAVIYW